MKKEIFELLDEYIDAKIDYAFASREIDEEGYIISASSEEKKIKLIKDKIIRKIINE